MVRLAFLCLLRRLKGYRGVIIRADIPIGKGWCNTQIRFKFNPMRRCKMLTLQKDAFCKLIGGRAAVKLNGHTYIH